jgi:chemotaxis protein histidine kinase CheA
MVDDPNLIAIKLDQLRKEYEQNLPAKIDHIRNQWLSLRNGDWNWDHLNDLLNLIHKIAGSGGMYGFSEVSDVACKTESLLQKAIRLKVPMNKKEMSIMDSYLKELDNAINSHD